MSSRVPNLRPTRRRDFGRLFAQLLCALFAVVGVLPLALAILVRSEPVRQWVAAETARMLESELGVTATYRVMLRLWPLEAVLEDLVVPASDGGTPALSAERVAVKPRIFSLLAGRLDAGEIEIESPRARLVVRAGELKNIKYRLRKRGGPTPKPTRPPFSSLSLSDARAELDIEGVRVQTGSVDLDVFSDAGPSFEIALRADATSILRERQVRVETEHAKLDERGETDSTTLRTLSVTEHDDDTLCRLDARLFFEPGNLLVRRLELSGVLDSNPEAHSLPSCKTDDNEQNTARVAVQLSQVRLRYGESEDLALSGHIVARTPLGIINRFVRMTPLGGWLGFTGDLSYEGKSKLPELRGRLRGADLGLGDYHLAKYLDAQLEIAADTVRVPAFEMGFADGKVMLTNARIRPFAEGAPVTAERVDGTDMLFESMMRDLAVTPDTIVKWDLKKTRVSKVSGTLNPLKIDADLSAETRGFEVFDRAFHDPLRKHVIGVRAANVRSKIGVRPQALEFYDTRADFGESRVLAPLVSIGFSNDLKLKVAEGSRIDLKNITPLIDIPMAGVIELSLKMDGKANDPELTGDVRVEGLEFGGFPIGDIKSGKVRFQPLFVEFADVRGKKGRSDFLVPSARLDFDAGSSVLADALVKSDKLLLRDFFAMWLFDADPRFKEIDGAGAVEARVHYDLGGKQDLCAGGYLRVDGSMDMRELSLFEERYDRGRAEFDFRWSDMNAGSLGFDIDVPSLSLHKGSGSLLGSFSVAQGARVRGHVIGTAVPLAKIDGLGSLALAVDGRASAVAEISGSLDELALDSHVRISPLRVGSSTLPASELSIKLVPVRAKRKSLGTSRCGHAILPPFDVAAYEADSSSGVFHVNGALLGGQIRLGDLTITRQRKKRLQGTVEFRDLDLGAVSELAPAIALSNSKPNGKLRGKLFLERLSTDDPWRANAKLALEELALEHSGFSVKLLPNPLPIVIADRRLTMPGLSLAVRTPRGETGVLDVNGSIDRLGRAPQVDAGLSLRKTDLSAFTGVIPRAERVKGELSGKLHVTGAPTALVYTGGFWLRGGEMYLRGFPSPISDIELALALEGDELRIARGSARVGSGTINLSGAAPLHGFELGAARAVIKARELSMPAYNGVRTTLDADLVATWRPASEAAGSQALPRVTGDITLRSLEYTRPVTMTADISTLAQRGKRTEFEAYDPADDSVEFDVTLRANRTLKISNNLIEMELEMQPQGLLLAGTNQRFGLRGAMRIKPGGRIRLRRNEFEIRQGYVRFDDLTRIAPLVDVTAVTEYRRYSDSLGSSESGSAQGENSGTSGSASSTGGRWLITMHAHGDADKLRIDLTSEPALAQDDIFLLLTVGLTRAELDQAQSASVGESVALEALGTLTGADRAVKEAVPVIDEFRFGSAYSSRTGRTEPTVTIGKRLAERIRANVTSGLSESREIRSNLEWRLSPRVSVEGSYDNVNDISSSSLGNLGADVRWRLEFE